jgi:DNA topoisomerase I
MELIAEEITRLTKKKIEKIINDPEKTAKAVNLVYVNDLNPGIERIRKGKDFAYVLENNPVKDKEELQRIKSLVIPPAWENVWICILANGHLQATGLDARKRKQYRYHPLWNSLRNHTKFYRLYEFGKVLPKIRLQLEKDLSLQGLPQQKVLAAVVSLMERTHIRVGNTMYEKLYGSYGLTTLKDKHVAINGSTMKFSFKGKKGVQHDISIKNKKLSALVQQCRDIPGKELFQYYDEEGKRHSVDSGMVNEYIKTISGSDFTAKDFRTWAGTVESLMAFRELGFFETATESKKKITEALDMVSKLLGNTRTVCKKYYVHPLMLNLYEDRSLEKYIKQLDAIEQNDDKTDLTAEEKMVMKILETN